SIFCALASCWWARSSAAFLLGADVPARDIDRPVVRRHRPGDPAPGAVLVPKAIFYPYGRPAARELIARGERMRRIVRMAQLVHVQAFDLRVAPPERLRPRRIDADEVAREGRNAEQILGAFQMRSRSRVHLSTSAS